jgi:hypothetical protein
LPATGQGQQDLPDVGRIALLKDPWGASFYVIELTAAGHRRTGERDVDRIPS